MSVQARVVGSALELLSESDWAWVLLSESATVRVTEWVSDSQSAPVQAQQRSSCKPRSLPKLPDQSSSSELSRQLHQVLRRGEAWTHWQ